MVELPTYSSFHSQSPRASKSRNVRPAFQSRPSLRQSSVKLDRHLCCARVRSVLAIGAKLSCGYCYGCFGQRCDVVTAIKNAARTHRRRGLRPDPRSSLRLAIEHVWLFEPYAVFNVFVRHEVAAHVSLPRLSCVCLARPKTWSRTARQP